MTDEDFRVEHVGVVGAGTMGAGIAQVCAMAGYDTTLFDARPGAVDAAIGRTRANLEQGISRGKVSPETRDVAIAHLTGVSELEDAVHQADLVIEAVPEDLSLKSEVFARLDHLTATDAILASNTSSLSVSLIGEATTRSDRVIGLHFFNPVHIMRLLEVVRARDTSEATLATCLEFARSIGKEPIVVTDTPGFASSRLGIVLGLEAMRMLEQEVASVEDIDRAMELGYNHPMGPLKVSDLVGLDIRLGIAEYLSAALGGEQYDPPAILRRMVAEGKLGRKTGRGFYDWSEE